MKRLFAGILTLLWILGYGEAYAAPVRYSDVPTNHWAYYYIQQASQDNVMVGTGTDPTNGTPLFSPDAPLTVASFLTMMARAFYPDEIEAPASSEAWYAGSLTAAKNHGLLDGLELNLEQACTRYEMAKMVAKIVIDQGIDLALNPETSVQTGYIADWAQIPHSYQASVLNAYSYGILGGVDGQGTFSGFQLVTRAQAAVIYCRIAEKISELPDREEFSLQYQSSPYYTALLDVEISGDQRSDLLAVAESQLGYHEGDQPDQLDGSYNGSGNYSEYGRYFGSNGRAWCSEFASWCARQAKIPTTVLGNSRSASISTFNAPYYTWGETVYAGGDYIPQPGDLVLFAWTGTSLDEAYLSHTAIVTDAKLDGDILHLFVIHGNSNGSVRESEYIVSVSDGSVSRGQIGYFVAPDYTSR